jgi:hypothetical protein
LILLDSMIVYIYTQNLVSKDKFSCYNVIHPPVTIISKNLHFTFIQLMMYIVFIIDYIQHLMNESKMLTFAYICDRRVYYYSCRFHQAHQWWMHCQNSEQCLKTSRELVLDWLQRTTWSSSTSEAGDMMLKKKTFSVSFGLLTYVE